MALMNESGPVIQPREHSKSELLTRTVEQLVKDLCGTKVSNELYAQIRTRAYLLSALGNVYELGLLEGRRQATQTACDVIAQTVMAG